MTSAAPGTAVVRPRGLAEAHEAMVASAAAGQVVVIEGGGTKREWGADVGGADVFVQTSGLDGLVAHNHGDMTAVVGAGMRLEALQQELARAGQWLALDPPSGPDGATLGGLMATGEAGPRRHRYGTMRDLVIGVTVVLADGSVARSGGQVIKNVAGYDLAKLLCGSLGTLGLVTEVSLRLHPLAPSSATVRVPATPRAATAVVLDLLASPVVPSALDWAEGALWVRLEGSAEGVDPQVDQVVSLARGRSFACDALRGEEESRAWGSLLGAERAEDGETVARAASLPGRLGEVAEALERSAERAGVGASLTSRAGLGLHGARLTGPLEAQAQAVALWRAEVSRLGGSVVVTRRPAGLAGLVEVWGPAPSAVAVMRRVKEQLDPAGRLAPGRFSPWW